MSMQSARNVTEKHLPGLVAALEQRGRMALEKADPSELCELFRSCKAAGLIIPQSYGGLGASPRETVDILRVVGSLCPSLAVMMTMHYHTIATIVQLGGLIPAADELLYGIAQNQLLIASAFAEGKVGAEIFNTSVKVSPTEGGFLLRGTKKPCTMSHNMEVIVVGVARENEDGSMTQGFAVVFNDGTEVARERFWNTSVLQAADSNALVFNDVFVPDERMLLAEAVDDHAVAASAEETSLSGLCWFQLMVGGTYLGVASALVNMLLNKRNSDDAQLAQLAIELEGAHQALVGTARELEEQRAADLDIYNKALCTRFMVQGAVERATNLAVELLGGMAFIASDEVAYLLAASRAICFHPISRSAATPLLAAFLRESASPDAQAVAG
jgi:alkylation response protein AidB-like acyl-CoA dehydrogenase